MDRELLQVDLVRVYDNEWGLCKCIAPTGTGI